MTKNIPRHVAIICDGNRRWAKEHGLPSFEGHRRGYNVAIEIGKKARKLGIKALTFWIFSTENWDRSKEEVGYLMKLFEEMVDRYLREAMKEHVRIIHLGRKDRLPKSLREKIITAEEKTKKFDTYYLGVALDYGGRDEIVRAIKKISNDQFSISNINAEDFAQFLDTKDLPPLDLIIRPGGEKRLSGLLLWQSEYAELIFTDTNFPEFSPREFEKCIDEYCARQRRFGK